MANSSRDSGDNDLLLGSSGRYSNRRTDAFDTQFRVAVYCQPLASTPGVNASAFGQEEPARLTGRVILVSGRFQDKPVDLRDAVEARIGGRSGSRNPSPCGGLITRTPSRRWASAICSCNCFILVQCTFGLK